jgi:hypothetical protein
MMIFDTGGRNALTASFTLDPTQVNIPVRRARRSISNHSNGVPEWRRATVIPERIS